MVLETSAERVALLKAGVGGGTIERLFIKMNGYTIKSNPQYVDLVEV